MPPITLYIDDEIREKLNRICRIKGTARYKFVNELIKKSIKENEHLFSENKQQIEKKQTEEVQQIKESEKKEEQTEEKDTPTITKGDLILLEEDEKGQTDKRIC